MTLAADMITDLDALLNTDEFAVEAVYTPSYTTYPAVDLSDIHLGYPTILTSADHGIPDGVTVTLAGFEGDDAADINGGSYAVQFATDDTFAVDIDTTGLDITIGATDPTATPAYPDASTTKVIMTQEDGNALGMDGTIIMIEGKTSVFSAAKPGDAITIGGVNYKIKNPPFHDGTGMTRIELNRD